MKKQATYLKRQSGVVLFIALVALVVMSIAAAALIRSVDTNTTIAGNLSFQQSALVSAGRGVDSAMTWLENQSSSTPIGLYTHTSGSAYFATYGNLGAGLNLDDRAVLKDDGTWDNYGALASGTGITAGLEADSQNTISYIIERMCSAELPPKENDPDNLQKCLLGVPKDGGGGKGVKTSEQANANVSGGLSAMYRVTVRVAGPKNTRSYSQMYVY